MKEKQIPFEQIDTILIDIDGTLLDLQLDDHYWQEHVTQRYAEVQRLSLLGANEVLVP